MLVQYFHLLPAPRLLVCKQCRYAVWPDEIPKHLKAHAVKRDEINAIKEELGDQDLATRQSFKFPPKTNSAIPELMPAKEGIACRYRECGYVCSTSEAMRTHHKSHNLMGAKRGRPTKGRQNNREKIMQRGVAYQQFFTNRHHSAYFHVAEPAPTPSTISKFNKLREIAMQEVEG